MPSRVVYGIGPVGELLSSRAKTVHVVYVSDAKSDVAREAKNRGVDIAVRTKPELAELAGGGARHQGAVAIAGELAYVDVEDIVDRAEEKGETPLVVALDGVQDPHNLGAIIRSAYVLGAHGVVVPRDRAAGVTGVVTKASAGATEHVPIAQATNLVRALETLKQRGVWIAGVASSPEAQTSWDLDATGPLCLVLGSEGAGIRRLVAKTCDFHVQIPMAAAGVGSLNVSVAAGAMLYEVLRQRSQT